MKRLIIFILCIIWIGIPQEAQGCETPTTLPEYEPATVQPFIRIEDSQFVAGNEAYRVHGFNYYPSKYPWRRFLTEMNLDDIRVEMEMMQDVGANTLRIFLWNGALFQCYGQSTSPNEATFLRLDEFIKLANDYNFRLIVTLNDLPDLTVTPLYTNPEHVQEQTRIIINRYLDEPTILAWDLRNEGDIDYGSNNNAEIVFPRLQVLEWLHATSELVRSIDNNHLITAGWLYDADATEEFVDFLSFHHWVGAAELELRIRELRLTSHLPILLEEVGFSTHPDGVTEEIQAVALRDIFRMSDEQGLLGWMIWTAFDFPVTATCYPSPCESPDNNQHYFGIWKLDYSPKPAVEIVRQHAN